MRGTALRWDFVLPAVAGVVALVLLGLAATASGALRERQALVVEGHLLRMAHDLERDLRTRGPADGEAVLREALAEDAGFVTGLRILDPSGAPQVVAEAEGSRVLEVTTGAEGTRLRHVELFLGPAWRWRPAPGGPGVGLGGPPGSGNRGLGGGRRDLEIVLEPSALRPPGIARLLLPATAAAALVLVLFGGLGGRHLERRRDEERRAAERQRLEGLARAGAGLAHQLRTPLAIVKGSCQLLLEETGVRGESPRRLHTVLEQSDRMDRLLARLLDFARPPEPEPQIVELLPALEEILERLPTPGESRQRVVLEVPPGLRVRVDPEHLALMVENLVANALAFSPTGAPVVVRGRAVGREKVELHVIDRGSGPGDDPERWFEPYVTTRADGTGLGLPVARALAVANHGALTLEAAPEGGTCSCLTLARDRGGLGRT